MIESNNLPLPDDDWTLTIQPQRDLLDLRLGELWQYLRPGAALRPPGLRGRLQADRAPPPVVPDLQPLLTTLTFTFIIGRVASLPTDGLPPFLFYMSGTVVWSYFASCLTKTSETFVQNAHLFGKVYLPRMAVPVSVLISSLVTLGKHKTKTLRPGVQTLPGDLALAYARARNTAGSDFDRASRQQQVIMGILDRILSTEMLTSLIERAPALYKTLSDGIRTNLTLEDTIRLARKGRGNPRR